MATLEINGRRVQVDDSFLNLSPEQQQDTVEEIAASMGGSSAPAPVVDERPGWAWPGSAGGVAYDLWTAGQDSENYTPSAVPFMDPINAFANRAVDAIPVVGPTLTGWGNQVDASINNMLGFPEQSAEDRAVVNAGEAERFPVMDAAGMAAGTVAPLALLGGTALGGQLLGQTGSIGSQALYGGLSGAALGAADTYARTGDPVQSVMWGGAGGVLGAGAPFVGQALAPIVRNVLGQESATAGARLAANALERDRLGADDIARFLSEDPSFMVADAGRNLQGQAAAIATRPGSGQPIITDALQARQQGANARIRAAIDGALGEAQTPAQFAGGVSAQKQLLSPLYEEALANAGAVDTAALAGRLDSLSTTLRGDAQVAVKSVRSMLDAVGGDGLDTSARTLLETRKAIDGMLNSAQDGNVRRVLSEARKDVDGLIADAVPGIKDVDAQFALLSGEQNAFDLGQTILDSGRTAIRPDELADFAATASPNVFDGLSQGARAEIDRLVGTNASDRAALNRIIKGEGSWNYERLATTFGQDKADDLLAILSRERLMQQTENMAIGGSQTAPRQAAEDELFGNQNSSVVRDALNTRFGDAAARAVDNVIGGATRQQRDRAMAELAELLTANASNPQAQRDIALALSQHYEGMIPPAAIPLLLSPDNYSR